MNRLIIVGNGFDLAHGMPTTYSDFLKWYFIQIFTTLENFNFADAAIEVHKKKLTYFDKKYAGDSIVNCLEKNININTILTAIFSNPFEETPFNKTIPY